MHPTIISPQVESWEICVITRGEIGFANLEGARRIFQHCAPGLTWDAGNLLDSISDMFRDRAEGLLIVDRVPGPSDDDESIGVRWTALEASAAKQGWTTTRETTDEDAAQRRLTGWMSFRHCDTGRVIHLGVMALMAPGRMPLWRASDDAEVIISKLIEYGAATGVLWRMSSGVACCLAIRADRAERAGIQLTVGPDPSEPKDEPWWRWDSAPAGLHGAGTPIWSRDLTDAERHGFVVHFDVRAQGLAALATGRYGWGRPRRKATDFHTSRAGMWKIPGRNLLSLPGPPLIDERYIDSQGLTWVSTRAMIYLSEQDIEPAIYDSWTSATSSEIFKPFAQRIRNAIMSEACTVRKALKETYSEGPSMWVKPGGSIYRPDWYHTHKDTAWFNLRMKIDNAKKSFGIWPCRVYNDEISYPVDDVEAFNALASALGVTLPKPGEEPKPTPIGKLKFKGREAASDWQERKNRAR